MMKRIVIGTLAALTLWAAQPAVRAQDAEAEERSRFVRFVENQISSPNMQIRLFGLRGALSSDVSLDRITVSDADGVWLSIEQPQLQWQRAQLLRGRLVVKQLSAQSMSFERPPLPDESLPPPESRSFSLPQLPVSVRIDALELPRATFGEQVFGLASVLSVNGKVSLENDAADVNLDINRLDGPGGALTLDVGLENARLDMNVQLNEPADGVVANLLGIGGRPPVSLAITGGGPLSDLLVNLDFQSDGQPVLAGQLTSSRGFFSNATMVEFNLGGPLARILPAQDRIFFGDRTDMEGQVRLRDRGGYQIERFKLSGGALTADVSGSFFDDGFPEQIVGTIALNVPDGQVIALPGSAELKSGPGRFSINWADGQWSADMVLNALGGADFAVGRASLTAGGTIDNPRTPGNRAADYRIELSLDDFVPTDKGLAAAIGARPQLVANGAWRVDQPLTLDSFELTAAAATITGNGKFDSNGFDGTMGIDAGDLSTLSGLFGRPLGGQAQLQTVGTVNPVTGAFDVDVDGALTGLPEGEDVAGRLLAGNTRLTGGVARSVEGLSFRSFEARNDHLQFAANGQLSSGETDLSAAISLTDLGDIQLQSSGAAGLQLRLRRPPPDQETGVLDPMAVNGQVMVPDGKLAGQPVSGLDVGLTGSFGEQIATGRLSGSGTMAGSPVTLAGELATKDGRYTLSDLDLSTGDARLTGNVIVENGLANGTLDLRATDIAGLAALALVEASGGASLNVVLDADGGRQNAKVDGTFAGVRAAGVVIGSADMTAALTDLLGTPGGSVALDGRSIEAGGVRIGRINANARSAGGDSFDFTANADLTGTGTLATAGNVTVDGSTYRLALGQLSLDSDYGDVQLANAPARVTIAPSGVRVDQVALNVAGGTVTVNGSAGDQLALNARVAALPLSIANVFAPDLGLAGQIGGEIAVTGTAGAPQATFTLDGAGLTAAPMRDQGVQPLTLAARGQATMAQLRLDTVQVTSAQGVNLTGSGTIPLRQGDMDVSVSGTARLALAEVALADRGVELDGTVQLDGRATGPMTTPDLTGLVSVSGGRITAPKDNVELTNVNLTARLEGDRIVIGRASGAVRGGGNVSVTGGIGLSGSRPADLTIQMVDVRYTDGRSVSADLSATITITGPLAGGAVIGGTVDLRRTEILVAEIAGGGTELIAVQHINTDPGTLATLRRIASLTQSNGGRSAPPFALDLTVNAPNQIYVRGRGLDAEMGGQLRLGGTLAELRPTGGFNLIRGRLLVLDRRVELTSGNVTLVGNLDPVIDFTAQLTANSVTANIRLVGPASNLQLELSSSPALPDDEILAAVLFGSDIGSLSPIQIARLADAAAALTGGRAGLTGGLGSLLGVDEFDLVEGEGGGIGVRVGQYVTDNVYLGLETGADRTATTINLDITDHLTARGSVGTDAESSIGLFFERDY